MYLKQLDIQGFKSFAEKISLDFNQGITSVVGPNGSGKSNIADAIRWVLGEQSSKTLRGAKMEDVIFAGTEHRKPVGFAEVSLTIDNTDGKMAVGYSEITITRRVFRSGESEYLINKVACRLKDIHELFLDTGVGRDGYSIIGQGRVDEILSTRSEDRRHIFEEASGIMKYKVRKQEAEKKLELTEQNLLRINDIINELKGQIEPLKSQADTAKKYLSLRESLKELEVNVFIDSLQKMKDKISEYDQQYQGIQQSIEKENHRLEETTRANRTKTELVKKLSEDLNVSRQAYYHLEGNLEKCHSEARILDEKVHHLESNIVRIEDEAIEFEKRIDGFATEEEARKAKLTYLLKQQEEYASKLSESQKKLDAVLSLLNESEQYIEHLKTGIMDKLDIQSDKKTQINYIKTHLEGIAKRQHAIDQEIYHIQLENDREAMKKESLEDSIRSSLHKISEYKASLAVTLARKAQTDSLLSLQRKKQTNLKSDIQIQQGRHKMLCDMEKNLEGYNRSVKSILHACEQDAALGQGIHGALAQLITVDKKYETAIEMSLGGALQNIITSDEQDAKKAIEYLKKNKMGRATFLPISAVKGRYLDAALLTQAKGFKGFCGIASDLVAYDAQYQGILLSLLGRVVVVENLDAGIALAKKTGYAFKIVTLEGDILNSGGSLTGGSVDQRGTGILSRHREIDELKLNIIALQKEDDALDQEVVDTLSLLQSLDNELTQSQEELRNYELMKIRDESHLLQVNESIKKAVARIEMLQGEKEQLVRQGQETERELSKYDQELKEIENQMEASKKIILEHQEKFKQDQTVKDSLHTDITDFKISVNSILESIESVREALGRIADERNSIHRAIKKKTDEKRQCSEEIKKLGETKEGIQKTIQSYQTGKMGKTLEIDRLAEEIKVLEEELSEALNKLNALNKNILLMNEEFNRLEVKKAKLDAEIEAMQNRMWDEYEITYHQALEIKKDIGNFAQAQKMIQDHKVQIKQLGQVNVSAIEEYIKTKERFEFMTHQRNDMDHAKEKLHRVIYEMTAVMKRQFLEQFRLINDNFGIVFKELFGGGRAELLLSDKENVLDSGIEISVQPPGKRLQNMMLLSGGERAFTAIALLFAILRLRPTPFCVLDEIEAALDDANVYRFAQYVKRFSEATQFIMITHRKGTMENSDMLYGVTMQEHGISKVVSMKLGEHIA